MVLVLGLSWIPDFRYRNTARVAYTTGRWEVKASVASGPSGYGDG